MAQQVEDIAVQVRRRDDETLIQEIDWEEERLSNTTPLHAHWDCFSGAAGDMMLAACLDAVGDNDDDSNNNNNKKASLLRHIQHCIQEGLPELKGEFQIEMKRVWRGGIGSIAANYVTVQSRYHHEAAPVPTPAGAAESSTVDSDCHSHAEHSDSHSHEHNHEHGHSHSHSHENLCSAEGSNHDNDNGTTQERSSHSHEHGHAHSHHHTQGPLRNLPQIRRMLLEASPIHIPPWVKDMALAAFEALARAEAKTHGAASCDDVHFHEVGAIDSIVDTLGTVLALYYLGVTTISCSRLPLGEGTVWTDHGLLPVPAPATLRLLVDMPTCAGPPGCTGELVTPTAAALLRVLTNHPASSSGSKHPPGRPPDFTIRQIGIGAGTKDFEKHPNIIRLMLGEIQQSRPAVSATAAAAAQVVNEPLPTVTALESTVAADDNVGPNIEQDMPAAASIDTLSQADARWKVDTLTHLEANLDDTTGEVLAFVIDKLLQNGAIDAWVTPIVMKKGRAAHTLHCLCHSDCQKEQESAAKTDDGSIQTKLLEIMFRETTTLGIRIQTGISRSTLRRTVVPVQTPFIDKERKGVVNVKLGYLGDEAVSIKAEFDHCQAISRETGIPLKKVAEYASSQVEARFSSQDE